MPDDELRRVSVLFADIQGSTALIRDLDPEASAALLDPPVRAMVAAVEQFDGVVCHLGDGVLAIFGAPSVCEDHAVRACLAALAIREALSVAAANISVRMGIHTGDVVMRARRLGRAQVWEPIGPALHVAARLEQTADPGSICISSVTQDQARGFIETGTLAPVEAKGLGEPLVRHALLGAHRDADRWAVRSANGLVEHVGRVEELALLRAMLGADAADRPAVVQLSGPPGIGKSRLLHEALRSPAASSCLIVRLSGDPHGQETAFHAFAVWLRGWLDIRAGDQREAARAKIHAASSMADLDGPVLERLLGLRDATSPAFADLDAVDAGSVVTALLRSLARGRRIVLACEDVDCFDAASRDLLQGVLAASAREDMLVIATSRSRARLSRSVATRSITLDALSAEDTSTLFRRINGPLGHTPALVAAIQAKTGGNPLFVEEVSALIRRDAAHRDERAAEELTIPDRVEALIADRLARLPRAQKQLVQVCSVLGGVVPLRLLSRVMGVPAPELHGRLLRLQTEQVLHETRRYPDPQFAFKHALTRDAAYQMMLAARRRDLHARTVAALETDEDETLGVRLDDLCRHSVRADMPAKAVRYLFQAAALDAEKSAFQSARTRLTQAVELSRTLPHSIEAATERVQILLALRRMLNVAGQYAELVDILNEAETLAAQIGDERSVAQVMVQRVHVLNIMGRLPEAIALGERAYAAARTHNDPAQRVLAAHHLAQAYFNTGDLRAADARLRDALATMANSTVEPTSGSVATLPVLVHCTRSMTLAMLGDWAGAEHEAAAAHRLADRDDRPYDKAFSLFVSGLARLGHRPRQAITAFSAGLALCANGQIQQMAPPLLAGLGHALLQTGDHEQAAVHLRSAYMTTREKARPMMLCWAASGLALSKQADGSIGRGARPGRRGGRGRPRQRLSRLPRDRPQASCGRPRWRGATPDAVGSVGTRDRARHVGRNRPMPCRPWKPRTRVVTGQPGLTRLPGTRWARTSSMPSSTRNPIASRVSVVALPRCGSSTTFSTPRYAGSTRGSSL